MIQVIIDEASLTLYHEEPDRKNGYKNETNEYFCIRISQQLFEIFLFSFFSESVLKC